MSAVWNASTYDSERRRLVPCFDEFYDAIAGLIARFCPASPSILDLGAGTGLVSAAIVGRTPAAKFHLLDGSSDMLRQASTRLSRSDLQTSVQNLTADLPPGPFHAVVSALAIRHLDDGDKRRLYSRIFSALHPGGIFINAEQVSGSSPRLQNLFEGFILTARGTWAVRNKKLPKPFSA